MQLTKKTLFYTLLSAIVLPQNTLLSNPNVAQATAIPRTAETYYLLSQDIENMLTKIPFKSDYLYNKPTFTCTFKTTTDNNITEHPTTFYKSEFYKKQLSPQDFILAINSTKKILTTIKNEFDNNITYTTIPFNYIKIKNAEQIDQTKYTHIFQDKNKTNTHTLFYIHGGNATGAEVMTDNIKDTTDTILQTLNNVDTSALEKHHPIKINQKESFLEVIQSNEWKQSFKSEDITTLETINPYKKNPLIPINILEQLHQQLEEQIKIEKQCLNVRDHFNNGEISPFVLPITLFPTILFLINHGINVVLLEYDSDNGNANPLEQIIEQINNTYKKIQVFTHENSMLMGHSYGGFLIQLLIKHKVNFLNNNFAQAAIYAPIVNGHSGRELFELQYPDDYPNIDKQADIWHDFYPLPLVKQLNNKIVPDSDDNNKINEFILKNYFLFSSFSSQKIDGQSNDTFPHIINQLKIPLFLFQGTADTTTNPFSQLFDIIESFKNANFNNWSLFSFKHGKHSLHRANSIDPLLNSNYGMILNENQTIEKKKLTKADIQYIDNIRKQEFIRFLETLPPIIKKEKHQNINQINLDNKINDAIKNLTDPIEKISLLPGMNYQWFRKHILQEAN